MNPNLDIDKFIEKSGPLDLSGIDWSKAKEQPLSESELRCIHYMLDIETYTIAYLRDLVNSKAIEQDADMAEFIACWAYEEAFHSRALGRFLKEAGVPLDPNRKPSYQRPERFSETFRDLGASILSRIFPDFTTVYLTWGAIQELTTLNGYNNVARKSKNEILVEVLRRIMKDEARHFGFYYNKAMRRLSDSPKAQSLTSFMVKTFWRPVGSGIKTDEDVAFIIAYAFGDEQGQEAVRRIDNTISKLPGLEWFNRMQTYAKQSCELFMEQAPWKIASTAEQLS
jgi:rubrerythrin